MTVTDCPEIRVVTHPAFRDAWHVVVDDRSWSAPVGLFEACRIAARLRVRFATEEVCRG